MESRPTTKDIAEKAGVNQSTVSRALRNDRRLSVATRNSIQELAREMGYTPNASARALSIIRRAKRPISQHGTLALLLPYVSPPVSAMDHLIETTRAHAAKSGYKLDLIHFHIPGTGRQQLTRILKARGITGLVVLPDFVSTRMLKRLQLDWSLFSAVTLGHALLWPPLHRVSDNHFGNAKRLVRELIAFGYRRIGLCVDARVASIHADGGWEGGYLVGMQRLGSVPSPVYYSAQLPELGFLRDWVLREKLDAVITDSSRCSLAFIHRGFRVPEELGVASLIGSPENAITGINPNHSRVWTMAVDFLVHLIHSQQRGIPEFPQRILLEGTWLPGNTIRRVNQ